MTTPPLHVVYLHGFASSAQSSKAQYFTAKFAGLGITVHTPDLNEPSFETLTVTRMIGQVGDLVAALPAGRVVLMGSSMGAFVAWHAAHDLVPRLPHHTLSHMVLLAPAVMFGRDREHDFGPGVVDAWERAGVHEFFHYGYNEPRTLRYDFYADAVALQQRDVHVDVPTLVFQGTHDEVVPAEGVQAFFANRPSATVRLLEDGHQLLAHLDLMWEETRAFLG